jgi:hypothetical protein
LALSRSLTQLQKGVLDLKEPENNMNVFFLTMPFNLDAGAAMDEEPEKNQDMSLPENLVNNNK